MIRVRRAADRGHFDHGWLKTHHTFSFGEFHDPAHHHFRALRVINEDYVAPGQGFGMHPHRDMEIITYVLQGALRHEDSMGNGEVLRAGELQRMSAGSGLMHSEMNASQDERVHLYQIWLMPLKKGVEPSYAQKAFPVGDRNGQLQLVASPTGENGSLAINQDARVYLADLAAGQAIEHALLEERHAWLQVLSGDVQLSDQSLAAGDGAAISEENSARLTSTEGAEVMLFEMR